MTNRTSHAGNGHVADVGVVPWNEAELQESLQRFATLYQQRPIRDNSGGMKYNHCFAAWFVLQKLQPAVVIESGVYKGQGTWLIEQACPEARIASLDISFKRLQWRSDHASYFECDFKNVDWTGWNLGDSIALFDDHQNAFKRLQEIYWAGCRRALFEDNYPVGEGDCYSLRHVFAGVGHPRMQGSPRFRRPLQELRNRVYERFLRQPRLVNNQSVIVAPNFTDRSSLLARLECYHEIPPVYLPPLHDAWQVGYTGFYAAKPALLDHEPEHFDGDYGYICYVALQ
jgi:hypothetical protein